MTPGDDHHLAAFGFHLRQQRCLLLGRPLPAPLNPRNDLDFCQSHLLLERQKVTPGNTSLGGSRRDFYTRLTGRLRPFVAVRVCFAIVIRSMISGRNFRSARQLRELSRQKKGAPVEEARPKAGLLVPCKETDSSRGKNASPALKDPRRHPIVIRRR